MRRYNAGDEVPHPIEQEPSCQLSLYEQSTGLNYTLEIVVIKIQMNVLRTFGGRVHLRLFWSPVEEQLSIKMQKNTLNLKSQNL